MADQASSELPRIAFVFGDTAQAAHVREAMAGHAEIVYAVSSVEFDAGQLADARAAAALVNVDGGDWLDAVEAKLQAANVRVVFNDPEISQGLEGWERARWLRHLTAKLRGSVDFDPPRPAMPASAAAAVAIDEPSIVAPMPDGVAIPETTPAASEATVVERPLSRREIETMTADFVAVPAATDAPTAQVAPSGEPPLIGAERVEPAVAPPPGIAPDLQQPPALIPTTQATSGPVAASQMQPATGASAEPVAAIATTESSQADPDTAGLLDVDTEALSAMIDARLAAPESYAPSSAGETWAIPDAANASADAVETRTNSMPDQLEIQHSVEIPAAAADPPTAPAVTAIDADAPTAAVVTARDTDAPEQLVAATSDNDADVLASLPSLDDWRLLDPETDVAPAAKPASESKAPEPVLPDSFAGLELVPMETVIPIERNTDPIERWLDDAKTASTANADGGKA